MPRSTAMIDLGSSSISLLIANKDSLGDSLLRWQSIQKFIYFACTYSSSAYNFDIFSKVCQNVRFLDFLLCEVTIGLAYMCMDSFIKQYTRRYDCNKFMNPLLRGISYGRFLQTFLLAILHASYLSDSLRFLVVSFREVPPWSTCEEVSNTSGCVPAKDLKMRCIRNITTEFETTSAYFNYLLSFGALDRNTLTTRFFVLGLVWMLVFFCSSVTEETIVKILTALNYYARGSYQGAVARNLDTPMVQQSVSDCIKEAQSASVTLEQIFKLSFMCRSLSTTITLLFLLISTKNVATKAISQIMDIDAPSDFMISVKHVTYAYGIGFLGLYDFGTMSAYTMVDTAAVIFVAAFTFLAFMRSWITKILYLVMTECVAIDVKYGTHELFYAILPLTTEFLYAHKLYVFYLYGNVLIGTLVFMTNLILVLSKFLSYEFRSVKQIYIVGLLCCMGFALTIPLLALTSHIDRGKALTLGMDMIVTYLGGAYVAIVMWLYGLKKFCTDIQFWLGFRPTRFWTVSWALLPVALFCCTIRSIFNIVQSEHSMSKWSAVSWAGFSFLVVAVMNIKSMAGFLIRNNLAGVFKSHKNYGPPEIEDRKRRLYYSEYTRQRKCKHNCLVIDDWFECNHQTTPLMTGGRLSSSSSEASLMNLYDAKTTSRLRSVGALNPAIQLAS